MGMRIPSRIVEGVTGMHSRLCSTLSAKVIVHSGAVSHDCSAQGFKNHSKGHVPRIVQEREVRIKLANGCPIHALTLSFNPFVILRFERGVVHLDESRRISSVCQRVEENHLSGTL